jgi:Glycosyl transferase family 21
VTSDLSYLLPYRGAAPLDGDDEELGDYLVWLSSRVDLIVVDGSDPDTFMVHHERWGSFATHVRPDPGIRCLNGKVRAVLTGVRHAAYGSVVIADDDVRYDDDALGEMRELLRGADLVRPQNVFDPVPWHARWDTARSLLNRAFGSDHPGTLGVRRSFLDRIGGYDGDVLFENLELVRTVAAAGGRTIDAPGLYVTRRPPSLARFLEQRPRQAYDDFAQPLRLVFFLLLGPAIVATARRRPAALLAGAGAAVAAAEIGRVRHGGARVFDRLSPVFAPAWMIERACLVWLALLSRLWRGGCPYAGRIIPRAANPPRVLRRRLRGSLAD